MRRLLISWLTVLALLPGCKAGSSAVEAVRSALNPPLPPPDTIPELLDYNPDLGVNITEMARLPEGALWADLSPGEGAPVAAGDSVDIAFQGWLPDGAKVDSGETSLRIGQGLILDGLQLALPGMKPGGRRQVIIPPGLAYGSDGRDNIPPNAVLVYELELRRVNR